MRLDKATSVLYEEFSRTKLKEWILNGNILLNGEIASPREKVNLDDEIEVNPVMRFQQNGILKMSILVCCMRLMIS